MQPFVCAKACELMLQATGIANAKIFFPVFMCISFTSKLPLS